MILRKYLIYETIAVGLGLQNFFRLLGGAIGVAIASSILNSSLTSNLTKTLPLEYAKNVLDSPNYIRNGLPSAYFDATIDIYASSMQLIWYISVTISGIGMKTHRRGEAKKGRLTVFSRSFGFLFFKTLSTEEAKPK